tara:strand:+ start:10287 stop:11636 length:1350 start_codon:yes stop_codon:yes gene_type:complete
MNIVDVRRVKVLNNFQYNKGSVLYWMQRDKRVFDNWALIYAQQKAIENNTTLHVCFSLNGNFPEANVRQYSFMLHGLIETSQKLEDLNIKFSLIREDPKSSLPKFINDNNIGFVVTDFSPLRVYQKRTKIISNSLNIPFHLVDAHNIIPVWKASEKQEFAAHTIRRKIHKNLEDYLTDFPPLMKQKTSSKPSNKIDFLKIMDKLNIDSNVKEVDWLQPGESAAFSTFDSFLKEKITGYDEKRNDPNLNYLSNISPYLHYGHISSQRLVFELSKLDSNNNIDAFIEQTLVRKELADNFCYYNKNYDNFLCLADWAKSTLNEHRNDKRDFIYNLDTFENSDTHDDLWNAAQNQMRFNGKMHGYMRMYWAKKILEWTKSPEEAFQIAIELNDKYELDGRDPNGYTGVAWSIGGIHDRPWFERQVFGKIRYMNYNGCKRKFDVNKYIIMNKRS